MGVGANISGFVGTVPAASSAPYSIGDADVAHAVPGQAQPRLPVSMDGGARIETIDAAHFLAIVGIVFIHSIETPQLLRLDSIGTFGVPFYLFASLYFQALAFRRRPHRRLEPYIAARLKRLYVPYLAWMLIYLLARNVKHALLDLPPMPFAYWQLWTGTTNHLWFLPMLVIVSILGGILCRFFLSHRRIRWGIIMISAIVGTVLAVVPRPDWLNWVSTPEGAFFLQCWKTLPSVFLGLALAWWMAWERRAPGMSPAIGFAGVLMTVMMVADQIVSGYSRVDRTLSGLGWLVAALASWRGAWVGWLARLGKHSYGIYLSHVLFIEAVQALAHSMGYGVSLGLDLISITAGLTGAIGTTLLIAKMPAIRWLNGD